MYSVASEKIIQNKYLAGAGGGDGAIWAAVFALGVKHCKWNPVSAAAFHFGRAFSAAGTLVICIPVSVECVVLVSVNVFHANVF